MEISENIIENSLKTIAKGAGLVFLGLIFSKLFSYLYVMLVARLGTESYGLLSLGFTVLSLASIFALLGLDAGIIRYIPFYLGKNDKGKVKGAITSALKFTVPISLIVSFLLFIFAEQISITFFHNSDLIPLLKILSLALPFSVVGKIFLSSLRAFKRVDYEVAINQIFQQSVKLILTVIFLFLGYSLLGAAFAYIFAIILTFVLSFYFSEKIFPILKTKIKAVHYGKELLVYSLPLALAVFLNILLARTDLLMLGYFRTVSEVGIYNVAVPTATLMFMVPTALLTLFMPVISELYARKKLQEISKLYTKVSKWTFTSNFPIFLLITLFSAQILRIMFGPEYVAGRQALSILIFGYTFYSLSFTSENILGMLKKTKTIFWIILLITITNIFLNLFLIPAYGMVGGAISTSISFIIGSILMIFSSHKALKLQPFKFNYLKEIIAGLLSISLVYFLTRILFKPVPLYGLLLMLVIFMLVYLSLLILLRNFDKEDIQILRTIKSFLRKFF